MAHSSLKEHPAAINGRKQGCWTSSSISARWPQCSTIACGVDGSVVYKTVCMYISYFSVGVLWSLLGNTVVLVQHLFNTDTATISITFTSGACGYLAGSLLCGIVYDRIKPELSFALGQLIAAVFIGAAVFFNDIPGGLDVFFAFIFIQNTATAYIDAAGQTYLVNLWNGHRYSKPVLQLLIAVWSSGGVIQPLIAKLFFGEMSLPTLPNSIYDQPGNRTDWNSSESTWPQLANTTSIEVDRDWVRPVRIVYILHGMLSLIPGVMYSVLLCRFRSLRKWSPDHADEPKTTDNQRHLDLPTDSSPSPAKETPSDVKKRKLFTAVFVVLIFLFYYIMDFIQTFPVCFLNLFAVQYFHYTVSKATQLVSIFYIAKIVGCLLGAILSTCMRPFTMLCGNIALTFGAFVLLLGLADYWSDILWISTAMAGLGLSTMFITAVIWISQVLPFTGIISSIIFTGTSIGGIVSPIAISQMIQKSTPMWCVILEAAVSLGLVLVLVTMLFLKKLILCNGKLKVVLDDQKLSDHTSCGGEDDGTKRDDNG